MALLLLLFAKLFQPNLVHTSLAQVNGEICYRTLGKIKKDRKSTPGQPSTVQKLTGNKCNGIGGNEQDH